MPFIPHTPESLLPRSDSKNPASTCKGLTANGQPCRRSLSKSPNVSPSPSPRRASSPEAFCWQHKNQAVTQGGAFPQGIQSATIRERTSVDTLIDRLGLLEVEERKKERRQRKPIPRPQPDGWNSRDDERHRPQPKQSSNLELLCCIGVADERKRAPRPVTRPVHERRTASVPVPRPQATTKSSSSHLPVRPPINRDPSSRTGEFLSLIPRSASPQTTALLLGELAKPVSELDNEGFIYMFWLTPESVPAAPPAETASSLLAPPSRPEPGRRRTSDVLNTFATNVPNTANKKTIMLKIGRAQNVQRRLNQWTRQCGYDLSLIRYYPYHPTTLSETNVNEIPKTPRKVPNAHKVERLIHIELNGQRPQGGGKCNACGKEHREWFEVDASRDGVRAVDEVIRRWVDWAERDAR
ncbi:DUF1766-domain-containing protein [Mollisia scopiformis]|uniref:DUF1766-domain-containing protein n=1 Tax=Mollisia scopiformis TaxID=149040 RepID=A0A194WY99_MOLSC|nr:DUF1766-domain-containing protein [Mollisia scopiformis]KUJ12943.1 DUF1766-domain-containing protein [Mollisia scopiformis]